MIVKRIERSDHSQAVALMRELRISVGGLEHTALYRAMCSSDEVCCVVARENEILAGIALVELNRNWIWRRPTLLLRMLMVRIRRKEGMSGSGPAPVASLPLARNPPIKWSDAAPRVLFIGVHPAWRGKGIGKALYDAMFDEIRAGGHHRMLARIAPENIASLHLHKDTGWDLYEGDGVVFAIKNLRHL